jgi:hypothetical protein
LDRSDWNLPDLPHPFDVFRRFSIHYWIEVIGTIVFILPTQPASSGGAYNCNLSDFSIQAQAQSCYDYCIAQGAGDIHRLDGDNDGIACESL